MWLRWKPMTQQTRRFIPRRRDQGLRPGCSIRSLPRSGFCEDFAGDFQEVCTALVILHPEMSNLGVGPRPRQRQHESRKPSVTG